MNVVPWEPNTIDEGTNCAREFVSVHKVIMPKESDDDDQFSIYQKLWKASDSLGGRGWSAALDG